MGQTIGTLAVSAKQPEKNGTPNVLIWGMPISLPM